MNVPEARTNCVTGATTPQNVDTYNRGLTADEANYARARYGDETRNGRDITANRELEERARYGDTTNYGREVAATQWNYGSARSSQQDAWSQLQRENEMRYGRDVLGQ